MSKTLQMQKVLEDLRDETDAQNIIVNGKDKSLVNQFKLHSEIPNKWFDWVNRVDSEIMIIGQDWGPYISLQKLIRRYDAIATWGNGAVGATSLSAISFGRQAGKAGGRPEQDKDILNNFHWETFSSRTEKFILKAIRESYEDRFGEFEPSVFGNFFFTMAVLFTRKGKHFRGSDNFHSARSFEISYPYVSRQIDIVKPKVIMPLGDMGFRVLERKFNLPTEEKTLTQLVEGRSEFGVSISGSQENGSKTKIIPNFHPASHTSKELQMERWREVWGDCLCRL